MNAEERRMILELFDKLQTAEAQGGPRDAEAERLIRELVERQPAAPYYLAQAVLVQEAALERARVRIDELEQAGAAAGPARSGGFLGGLLGGGGRTPEPQRSGGMRRGGLWSGGPDHAAGGPWGASYRGGGFMGGALQTAMAVAGGVLAGNLIADLMGIGEAEAAAPEDVAADDAGFADEPPAPEEGDFGGGDFGGGDEFL